MYQPRHLVSLLSALFASALVAEIPNDFEQAFEERCKSVAAVEFFIQNEIDRSPLKAIGVVLDDQGHVVLMEGSVPHWIPPERFKNFKVRVLGKDHEGWDATYLGQNSVSNWHYIQIEESGRDAFTPITQFGEGSSKIGSFSWGIATMGEDWNYTPYFLSGRVSASKPLPWYITFSDNSVGTPGSVAFNAQGEFIGWIGTPTTDEKVIILQGRKYQAAVQMVRESNAFLRADEFYRYSKEIPSSATGQAIPWAGIAGMQSLDRDVAEIMNLNNQGALVISDVIEDGPAATAGLQSRDIVVGIEGEPLPKLVPGVITGRWFEKEIAKRQPGDKLTLDIVSGNEGKQIELVLGQQPKPLKEAERQYFDRLGFTARELTMVDALARREMNSDVQGAVVEFIKPNSPVQSAEMQIGDWIVEVDGQEIGDYASAIAALNSVDQDSARDEFVILVERNNETKVLRAKLN
ncbi:MAG: PDZ domain-containing protein [Verrucomicrobiota bacterium]